MATTKLMELEDAARKVLKEARDIVEKAAGASLKDDEKANYEQAMAKGRDLLEQIKTAKADQAVIDGVKNLSEELGLSTDDVDAQNRNSDKFVKSGKQASLGSRIVTSEAFKSLMAPYERNGFVIPNGTHVQSQPVDVKALWTGTDGSSAGIWVEPDRQPGMEMLGRRELKIRDLISVRRTTSDSVEFLRQVSHTNGAGMVPEARSSAPIGDGTNGTTTALLGGVKPEGAWAFEKDNATVKTIAEWVPATKRALADVAALEGLINDELRLDIAEKEEQQLLAGDGTGENLLGILNTPNRQLQAFDTDIFTTVRKAITKARLVGRANPTAIVINPVEAETIDLARDGNDRFYGAGPFQMGPSTLWGLPLVQSEGMPAGRAMLADWRKAVLWDREQTTVTFTDSHADFFIRNMVAILAEERLAFAVTRPTAFVDVDMAA